MQMNSKAQVEVFKAEMSINKAETIEELGLALDSYLDKLINAGHAFPKVSDVQRKHWRVIKRITGQTGILQVLMELLIKDPEFPVMPQKVQGQGPYLLMPNMAKREREYKEEQAKMKGNGDQSQNGTAPVKDSDSDQEFDSAQGFDFDRYFEEEEKNKQNLDGFNWDLIK